MPNLDLRTDYSRARGICVLFQLEIQAASDYIENLVTNLVDLVSKNGYLLLNVGPKPDDTIPGEAKELLLGMGKSLEVNGEAIYGTTPWVIAGEGPTRLATRGDFNEKNDLCCLQDCSEVPVLGVALGKSPAAETAVSKAASDRLFKVKISIG